MVKAVTKPAAEKPPSGGSVQVNLVEESNVEVAKEPVVVEFTRTERRRPPRTCVFVTLLLLVLLVGFLVVYSIEKSNRDKNRSMQWKYGEDGIKITDPPRVLNNSESSNTYIFCGDEDVSWETQEEFYTLSDAISQDDIMGLRPIFRKDLPHNYVAYWEAKINGKTGEKYVIISAARQTGDHRLAEEGSLPSPSDLLTAQANSHGYGCHRVYRLRPDGLMACEDTDVNKMVAITRNIDTDSTDIDWRHLDKQVTRELPNMEREWKEQAERLKKTPEWNRFEWLSMAVGDVSTKPTTLVEPITTSPTQESSVNLETEYNFEVEETEDGFKAELGLQPGDSVRIPLGEGFRDVRVKFVGLRDGDWIKAKSGKKRWQKRLCRVLSDLCDSDGNVDISMVSKRFFKLTKTGDRFIKVKVDADENFVRRNLGGREIRFKVELRTRGTQTMVINYGIILKNRRHRRAFSNKHFGIPHEELLPKYRQHHHGQCTTGSGPVAWAKILGYFNNMAAKTYNSSYPPLNNMLDWPAHLPLTMDTSVENMTQRIFSELGSHCSHYGGGVTSPAHMGRIKKAFEKVPGRELKVIHRGYHEGEAGSWKNLIIDLVKKGYPVIVSKDNSKHGQHHYVVVTRIRQSARYYSLCHRQTGECSPWTLKEESLMFVHEEDAPGKWEPADIRFMAAIFER